MRHLAFFLVLVVTVGSSLAEVLSQKLSQLGAPLRSSNLGSTAGPSSLEAQLAYLGHLPYPSLEKALLQQLNVKSIKTRGTFHVPQSRILAANHKTIEEYREREAGKTGICSTNSTSTHPKLKNYTSAQELADSHSGHIWAFEIRNEANVTIIYQNSIAYGVGEEANRGFSISPCTGHSEWYPVEFTGRSNIRSRLRLSPLEFDLVYGVHWPAHYSFGMTFIESSEPIPEFEYFTSPEKNHIDEINEITVAYKGYNAVAKVEDRDYKLVVVITIKGV